MVFATCTGAATLHRELRRSGVDSGGAVFDVVVIDEAAQALEVGCWIPLMLGLGDERVSCERVRDQGVLKIQDHTSVAFGERQGVLEWRSLEPNF